MRMLTWLAMVLAASSLLASSPAAAQAEQQDTQAAPQEQPPVRADGSIIVLGQKLPTDLEIMESYRSISRGLTSDSQMFLRCAELPSNATLSAILDAPPQLRRTQTVLHRYIQKNEGCYPRLNRTMSVPELGRCNPVLAPSFLVNGVPSLGAVANGEVNVPLLCRAVYDRGALYEQALLQKGGVLALDWDDTFDPAVRNRFMRREHARNDGRKPKDRDYFDTVACMVQISPQQGVAVVQSASGSGQEDEAITQLVGHGGPCIGYADEVKFDRGQFRAYVAEAVYSWIAAKRGVGSLVLRGVPIAG